MTTARNSITNLGSALHDSSNRLSRTINPSRRAGRVSAASASSSSVSMSYSERRMWASTGLRWASPATSTLKSRAAAPVASTESGRRITGAFGGVPDSTSQVASPMAANCVSMPFSSRFTRAFLWMAVRRRRASSKGEESSELLGKRSPRLTGLCASSRSNAHSLSPIARPGVRSNVPVFRSRYRRRRLRPEVSTRSFRHRSVARRTASRRAALG